MFRSAFLRPYGSKRSEIERPLGFAKNVQCSMETITCTRCGQTLPRSKLERMKTGTYRRVCNHCKWLYYVKPARDRRILRELEARKNH